MAAVTVIRWSPRAASDLEDICEYIAQDSDYYARIFAQRVMKAVEAIPDFPRSGRMVPEYQKENIREKIIQNYRIVYRLHQDAVEIVAIVHSARQLSGTLDVS